MNDRPILAIRAVIDELAADHRELLGRPGAMVLFRMASTEPDRFVDHYEANVCCPGCGAQVVYETPATHEITGPESALECSQVWVFKVCCGWRGWLREGWWIADPEVTVTT